MLAIEEADVILFLVEVNTGITDLDQMMADILRRTSEKKCCWSATRSITTT